MINTWPGGRVPYEVADDLPTLTRKRLQRAIDEWDASTAAVRLQPRGAKDRSFVVFRSGSLSSSSRGKVGGEQVVTLSSNAAFGVIMHEIGHAVGLTHEHNRPDRDEYIEVVWPNIRPEALSQFQQRDEPVPERPYDLDSIMHYAQLAYSWNNHPTIRVRGDLPDGVLVGQRRRLSAGDLRRLEELYADGTAA